MCGICGVVVPEGSSRTVDSDLIVRMRDVMVHRGPDDAGIFVDRGVGLGHRRLSIVDVALGKQPMQSEGGDLQIVYNGEVYNHPALKKELESHGDAYRTHCDTETVLKLVERYGVTAPERLRGMFAFAVWDRRKRELMLARDPFGIKPLYYVHAADGTLYFASEMKALVAAGAVQPTFNFSVLPDFLANHAPSGDDTLFSGIKRLTPGHTLVWRNGQVEIREYWDLHFPEESSAHQGSENDLVHEFGDRLKEAVQLCLMSDVPLGAFLSGGIDSAAITAVMSQLVGSPVKTFSVAFAEREANELRYARMVAKHCGTEHHEVIVSPDQFFQALPRLLWHEDEPLAHPSSIALNFVSQLAVQHVKVVLTGEGSDETLAGYGRYRATILNRSFGRRYEQVTPAFMRSLVKDGVHALPRRSRIRQKLNRTFLTRPADLDTLYFDNFAVFGKDWQSRLYLPEVRSRIKDIDPYAAYHAALDASAGKSLLNQLLYADTKTYLHELLMKQDQMSMAASIESRVPFLDHVLVEWVAALPQRYKLRGLTTKWILREATRKLLPPEILSRRKMGFPVPVGTWLRGPYRHLVDEFILGERAMQRRLFDPVVLSEMVAQHCAGAANHSERLWSLINLEMWQRMQLDGEDPDDISVGLGRSAVSAV